MYLLLLHYGEKAIDQLNVYRLIYESNGNLTAVSAGGPSLNYNAKNQTTSIGSNSYTYSGPDQTDRVQINSTTLDYSGLGLSRQEDSSGTTHFVRCSCGLPSHQCQKHRVKTCQY
jgi:hypothetical protein